MLAIFYTMFEADSTKALFGFLIHSLCLNLMLGLLMLLAVAMSKAIEKIEKERWLDHIEIKFLRACALLTLGLDALHLFNPFA